MMESLRISEARPYPYGYNERRTKEASHRILRLPTPEESQESQSSIETLERHSTANSARLDGSSHDYNTHRRWLATSTVGNADSGRSHRQYVPDSPPYGSSDTQRPSLPPLKTVLGDSLSSPPQTPTSYGTSGQLSPREPTFMTGTYKPPSLYPNKKQRTGFGLESALPASTLSSPGLPNATHRPRPVNGSQPSSSALFGRTDVYPTWGASVQHPSGCSSPEDDLTHRSAASNYSIADIPQYSIPKAAERRLPVSIRPPYQLCVQEQPSAHHDYHTSPSCERRLSLDHYSPHGNRPYDFTNARKPSYHPTGREATSPRTFSQIQHVTPVSGRHAVGPLGEGPGLPNGLYDMNEAPYFMPSHYENHHGKARKRSNLPKHSTEIMKTWFDQNIVNPYPSEEQKALFSVATGISMTQVSNWFINHRRRCPELRDKREKGRGDGADD